VKYVSLQVTQLSGYERYIHGKTLGGYSHVLLVYRTESRVIQTPMVRPIQVIKKDWIRDLLD
jgi:hypothetical protein